MSAGVQNDNFRVDSEHPTEATEPIVGLPLASLPLSSNSVPSLEPKNCSTICIESTDGAADPGRLGKISSQSGSSSATERLPASQRTSVHFAPAHSLEEYYADDAAATHTYAAERRVSEALVFKDPFEPDLTWSRKSSSGSETDEYLRPGAFAGHRDTLARIQMLSSKDSASSGSTCGTTIHKPTASDVEYVSQSPTHEIYGRYLPRNVIERILAYLAPEDCNRLRLICKISTLSLQQPLLSTVQRMPGEILQMMYAKLSPGDFDAIRHTCNHLFLASFDKRLLLLMLQRSGALCALQHDLRRREETMRRKASKSLDRLVIGHAGQSIDAHHSPKLDDTVSDEWLYSKRLATEARLSPAWKGVEPDLAMAEGF